MQSTVVGKACTGCGKHKPHSEFNSRAASKDGLQYQCRSCDNARGQRWRRKHAGDQAVRARRRATSARYLARANEQIELDWNRLRPDGLKACRSCAARLPREGFHVDRREADGRTTTCVECIANRPRGSRWQPEWTYTECYLGCGAPVGPDLDFHVEHVVPLSRGGPDVPENRLPSCPECNRGVGGKWSQTATEYLAKTGRAIPAYLVGLEARMWDLSKTPD